jgi:hypothetical protein
MYKYKYAEIEAVDYCKWDKFVNLSCEGSIFHLSKFFNVFHQHFRLFFILKGENVKAGVLCPVEQTNSRIMVVPKGLIYTGIIFEKGYVDSIHESKIFSTRFGIIEVVVDMLGKEFDKVSMTLLPDINDIRPFLWHNYNSGQDENKYRVNIRYTSIFDISQFSIYTNIPLEENPLFSAISSSRRQEIRYAIQNECFIEESSDFSPFFEMYFEQITKYENNALQIIEVLKSLSITFYENIRLFYSRETDGSFSGAALFGVLNKKAYYLYGVTPIYSRKSYSGSYLLWKSFINLSNYEIRFIDMEGVNSPRRGWFKLSFGGTLTPYYRLSLDN